MQEANRLLNYKTLKQTVNTAQNTTIGGLLLSAGKISLSNVEQIITLQKQKSLRFGDAGKELGLINDDDIQKALSNQFNFPFLAASEEQQLNKELIAAYQPFSAQVEALRAVREELLQRWFNDRHKSLAIVSPSRKEGRSFMAANLAIVFSQLGERTLLIDADLRQPRQHVLFKQQGGYGLSDLLAGRGDETVITRIPAFRDLSILKAGTVPPNPIDLIHRGLTDRLEELQTQFDVILIDTPAVANGIDAQIIASICGGALMVARKNKTRLQSLQLLNETLQKKGSQCLTSILANF
jgi:chain length determinant protein tyrosine kinase EpsG